MTPSVGSPIARAAALSAAALAAARVGRLLGEAGGLDENHLVSPWSAAHVLAELRLGATGQTAEELDGLLGVPFDELRPSIRAARDTFAQFGGRPRRDGSPGPTPIVTLGSALFVSRDAGVEPGYRHDAAVRFGAELLELDPGSGAAGADAWIERQTHGRVSRCPVSVTEDTALVLLDTVYFDARWACPFSPGATRTAPFACASGEVRPTPMMHSVQRLGYGRGDRCQRVDVPYSAGWTMRLTLPDEGASRVSVFDDIDLRPTELRLTLPRWDVQGEIDLKAIWAASGAPTAFADTAPPADYSRIGAGLAVDAAKQLATITVAEAGTVAAAVTAVAMTRGAFRPTPPLELSFDRPFAYEIRHDGTGIPLFWGWLAEPETRAEQETTR